MRRVGEVGEIKRDLTMVAVRGGEGSWTSTHMHAGLRAVNKELSLEVFLYLYLSHNLPTTMAGGQEKSFAEQMRFLMVTYVDTHEAARTCRLAYPNSHMGQILQDGENACFMSFFYFF